MKKIIRFPAPVAVEDYLEKIFPDPEVRDTSDNVQKYREILSRMYIASISPREVTDWESLRWFIHDQLLAMNELEMIHGVVTSQVIGESLWELQFPGTDPE